MELHQAQIKTVPYHLIIQVLIIALTQLQHIKHQAPTAQQVISLKTRQISLAANVIKASAVQVL